MKNSAKNEPMTKAQRHVIIDKRCKVYDKKVLKDFIREKYNVEEPDLRNLTKEQAQDIIVSFKPHPNGYITKKERKNLKKEEEKAKLEKNEENN